ncbi:hypothetical protein SNEBB_005592 [Seison nebaliae]|nr:hypothetical protein SNEBB_005592 [Seison nebaliae]
MIFFLFSLFFFQSIQYSSSKHLHNEAKSDYGRTHYSINNDRESEEDAIRKEIAKHKWEHEQIVAHSTFNRTIPPLTQHFPLVRSSPTEPIQININDTTSPQREENMPKIPVMEQPSLEFPQKVKEFPVTHVLAKEALSVADKIASHSPKARALAYFLRALARKLENYKQLTDSYKKAIGNLDQKLVFETNRMPNGYEFIG